MKYNFGFFFKKLCIAAIITLRPLLGANSPCKFAVSCSEYAIMQLETQPFHKALWRIIKRLLMCSPFYWPNNKNL